MIGNIHLIRSTTSRPAADLKVLFQMCEIKETLMSASRRSVGVPGSPGEDYTVFCINKLLYKSYYPTIISKLLFLKQEEECGETSVNHRGPDPENKVNVAERAT